MSRDHVSSGLALRIFTDLALLKQATPQGKFALMSMSTDGKKKLSCGVPCNPYPIVRLGAYKEFRCFKIFPLSTDLQFHTQPNLCCTKRSWVTSFEHAEQDDQSIPTDIEALLQFSRDTIMHK